jgi:hypothetical protein
MAHVLEFGGYTFPVDGLSINDNFGDVVTKTSRLPGLSGGFDEYGSGQAPNEVGNVSISFVLVAQTRSAMQAMRDAVKALERKGQQELRWMPEGFTEYRFCNARISNIRIPQRPSEHTDLHQPVSINFQVSDPCWYSYPFEVWYLDGSVLLDGETNLVGWAADYTLELRSNEVDTLTIEGSADTFPVLCILPPNPSDELYTPFKLQRLDENGTIQDEIHVMDSVGEDYLTIDCRKYEVYWSTFDYGFTQWRVDWIDKVETKRAEFFRLVPGANYIRLIWGPDTPMFCEIRYLEAWR